MPAEACLAPLAFSQLAHWQLYRLEERPSTRSVASATQLSGRLDLEALAAAIAEVKRRHEVLRTQVVCHRGSPAQRVDEPGHFRLQVADLTTLAQERRALEVQKRIDRLILEPIDVAMDPLFGAELLKLERNRHVLIMALEHMISDVSSLAILRREILCAYQQAMQGHAFQWPEDPLQFTTYAVRQQQTKAVWLRKHGGYWRERLSGCPRVRFQQSDAQSGALRSGWGNMSLRVDGELKAKLSDWCRLRRTSLAMGVFTAYVAATLHCSGVAEAVIRYQGNGRTTRKMNSAVGFYASRMYLRVVLNANDTFSDLLTQLIQEYCNAYEHDDFSLWESQEPEPECARNAFFNWIPGEPGGSAREPHTGIVAEPVAFANPWWDRLEWDNEPMMSLSDTDEAIIGAIYFSRNLHSDSAIELFGRTLVAFINQMVHQPQRPIKDIAVG